MTASLSKRDVSFMDRAMTEAKRHSSGGTYDMVALWAKGSNVVLGRNNLARLATVDSENFPEPLGTHAELNLYLNMGREMTGGTIYIAGHKGKQDVLMRNTGPCIYCREILMTTKTKWLVFMRDSKPVKSRITDLPKVNDRKKDRYGSAHTCLI